VFNSPVISGATQQGIFTGFESGTINANWLFPVNDGSTTTDLGEVQLAGIIVGGVSYNSNGMQYDLADVPEPPVTGLVWVGLGLVLLVNRNRRTLPIE
jgi:hypothetical protein